MLILNSFPFLIEKHIQFLHLLFIEGHDLGGGGVGGGGGLEAKCFLGYTISKCPFLRLYSPNLTRYACAEA